MLRSTTGEGRAQGRIRGDVQVHIYINMGIAAVKPISARLHACSGNQLPVWHHKRSKGDQLATDVLHRKLFPSHRQWMSLTNDMRTMLVSCPTLSGRRVRLLVLSDSHTRPVAQPSSSGSCTSLLLWSDLRSTAGQEGRARERIWAEEREPKLACVAEARQFVAKMPTDLQRNTLRMGMQHPRHKGVR